MRCSIWFVGLIGGILFWVGTSNTLAALQPISILPLGDSITYGFSSGGYRAPLYTTLTPAYDISYLGSWEANPGTLPASPAGKRGQEGHSSYNIPQIGQGLDGVSNAGASFNTDNGGHWLDGGNGTGRSAIFPDVILLLAGGNDAGQVGTGSTAGQTIASRLDALIDKITTLRPNAKLLVASITPQNGVQHGTTNKQVILDYNNLMETVVVPKYAALGRHVYYVEQYASFVDVNGDMNPSLFLSDGLHPNAAGNAVLAANWAGAVTAAVPEPSSLSLLSLGAVGLLRRRR